MQIRPAHTPDIAALLTMEQGIVSAERAFDSDIKNHDACYYDFPHIIADDQSLLLVIEDNEALVGCGFVQLRTSKPAHEHDRHGYLSAMYVAPSHRGQGLITQLIEQLVAWSKAKGVETFFLDVYHDNAPAVRAYEKLGFKPCLLEMKLHRNDD